MSDVMITLTNRDGQPFYVNAFVIDMVEPHPQFASNPLRSVVWIGAEKRKCCEEPADIVRRIQDAKTTFKVSDE